MFLEGLLGLHRTVQLQLLQHYWLGHGLRLLWYWMVCPGNEQRSFCLFWDRTQELHFGIRPSFPHSQSLPLGSFHTSLFLFHQRADKLKNTITEKITKLITWTTALSNSMKLRAMLCRATQDGRVTVEFWQNVAHWRREWQTPSVFLPWEPHEQ